MTGKMAAEPEAVLRDGFLLLGNELALDFLNTRPVMDSEATELLPDFAALLRWFRAAGLLTARRGAELEREWGGTVRADSTLQAMIAFREELRREVVSWERGTPLHRSMADELNRLMAAHPMLTRLKTVPGSAAVEHYFNLTDPEGLFAPIADSAAMLFSETDHTRVRQCPNCVLHFHDTSKKGNRRWCSMSFCGNRQKVAAYAARQRAQAEE